MSLLRITFVITRNRKVPPQVFEDLLCDPALQLDLGGRVEYEGRSRFTVVLEGKRRDVEAYKTYITVGKAAFGKTSHITEYTPTALIFGDYIKVDYNIEKRGTQVNVDDDVKL